jgi:hypothetical protein
MKARTVTIGRYVKKKVAPTTTKLTTMAFSMVGMRGVNKRG